jgi:EAL and modified HD-GYP domain-containing signal transduction protein
MEVFVARQPIFDRADRVAGYELLYRSGIRSSRAWIPGADRAEMSSRVVVDAFLGIGLHRLTNGRPAFINCTRELLVGGAVELLDPTLVVLELLEDLEPDEEVVAACERLARVGYRIALDDFVYSERWEPLLKLADVIKIDVLAHSPAELAAQVERLRGTPAKLLAEKVETREVHDLCTRLGFELFQGFFYSRPETMARPDLNVRQLEVLRLLKLLRDLDAPDSALENEFRSDVSLSYKLLRMANSAALGSSGIRSIGHAIRLLGREPLYRWLALLLISASAKGDGIDAELVQAALVRARMCEMIAVSAGRQAVAGSLFLVGLFSLLDALLASSMDEVLSQMALADSVAEALLHREGPLAAVLEVVEAYEAGQWDRVALLAWDAGVSLPALPELYLQSLAWARNRVADAEV